MFLESNNSSSKHGWIEVICGSMFSGKTEELIRRLKRAELAKQKLEIYKPALDTRFHHLKVVSHSGREIHSTPVPSSANILSMATQAEVVGIDEAQFFDNELPAVCAKLANLGIRVIVAGLDMDYQGKPFGPMPQLLAIAEFVTKVHAICLHCGQLAYVSHRKSNQNDLVVLGETEIYEPLCRSCFNKITNQ
ncbi:MAG: thymidine kinase [Bacteroidota bacterium]